MLQRSAITTSELDLRVKGSHLCRVRLEVVYIRSEATDPFAFRQSTLAPRFATPLHCRHRAAFNGLLLDWSSPFTLWLNLSWHLLPKYSTNFARQEQKVFYFSLTGRSNPGITECISFQLLTRSCRHRTCASDRTILASSSLSSIERCNCGQWSSTVREG